MKILWVKAGKLLPVDAGGKIRSYNILRHLQQHHELILVTPYGGKKDLWYESELNKEFPGACPIWTSAPDSSTLARLFHYLYCFPSGVPFSIRKFTDRVAGKKIEQLIAQENFDAIICDFLAPSLTFPKRLWGQTILFQHNVETVLWERMLASEPSWLKRLLYLLETGRMRRYECSSIGKFQHVIAVSDQDRDYMGKFMP